MSIRTLTTLLCAAALLFPAAAGARPFETGFFDSIYLDGAPAQETWLDRTVGAHAGVVRLTPSWAAVAPQSRPPGFDPSNPGDPAYNWGSLDAAVRAASSRGLDVLLTLNGAPRWAEGANRPRSAPAGSWRPSPSQVGAFARAAATRYSGSYPDPQVAGASLPRIRLWQIWNEPNLSQYITPQWVGRRGHYVAFAPGRYRAMLNAGYAAIKTVHADNVVGTAGTAPYGDPRPGALRIMPVTFLRKLLSRRTSLDALAHHPYGVRGPTSHALNRNDAAVPDLSKLTRVLRAAQRAGHVSRGHKRLWVTEISWDSSPPDPNGVPAARHARWLEQSFYVLWRQGVDLVTWFRIVDESGAGGFSNSNQSGVYLRSGKPKRALTAFTFPFVLDRARHTAWGKAPAAGQVEIQRRFGSRWRTVARPRTGASNVFQRRLGRMPAGRWRARQGANTSLEWRLP